MIVGVYSNIKRDSKLTAAKRFASILKEEGVEFLAADFPELNGGKAVSVGELAARCGLIVVFGGDGTVLSVIKTAAENGVPVLGVNMGRLGFLTETDGGDISEVVSAIRTGGYYLESRSMIEAETAGGGFTALNEIALKGDAFKTTRTRLFVDGFLTDAYFSDGVLVCTPTGSTAYSLAAGGPIVAPDVSALIINPLNPHSLHSRPFVVSDGSVIEVEASELGDGLCLAADGVFKIRVGAGERVTVRKSGIRALFAKIKTDNFYTRMLNKFCGGRDI